MIPFLSFAAGCSLLPRPLRLAVDVLILAFGNPMIRGDAVFGPLDAREDFCGFGVGAGDSFSSAFGASVCRGAANTTGPHLEEGSVYRQNRPTSSSACLPQTVPGRCGVAAAVVSDTFLAQRLAE